MAAQFPQLGEWLSALRRYRREEEAPEERLDMSRTDGGFDETCNQPAFAGGDDYCCHH